ncbi:MAG: 2-amino-4-hydroxy-6-hydroxymethyldihydropteridine diphosphokinase [Rhodoglobus sp.]
MIDQLHLRVETPAVIALGSNLGDREATLRAAVRDIAAIEGVVLLRASNLYETPAVKPGGVDTDAPAYLNAVVAVRSALDPHDLLAALNAIENAHGRVRQERWGDRTLDLDIVSFGGQQLETPDLTLPHPRAFERAFVLAPWLEVEPAAVVPGRATVGELLGELLGATGDVVTVYPAEPLL